MIIRGAGLDPTEDHVAQVTDIVSLHHLFAGHALCKQHAGSDGLMYAHCVSLHQQDPAKAFGKPKLFRIKHVRS